jgi:hypothetical protein
VCKRDFLAIRKRIAPNKIRTVARPCAPPLGIARKYTTANMIELEACIAYFSGSPIESLFPIRPIMKNVIVG